MKTCELLKKHIRDIPDFPKKGILFRDITPLLADPKAFAAAVDAFAKTVDDTQIDRIAAVEARGFIFGSVLARKLGVGFVPIRKKGKLPFKTESITYDLEYGTDTLEVHIDAFDKGQKVWIVDDLLATGGTMAAACRLVEKTGAKVQAVTFLVELCGLNGRKKLTEYDVNTILSF